MNYYDHHIGDYDAATAHLSWLEDLAYTRLMRLYYRTEKPVPADLAQVCRLVRASNAGERKAVSAVLHEFFDLRSDGWHQKRCDEELEKMHAKSSKARASAAHRWQSGSNANASANASESAMRTHTEGNAPNSQAPIASSQQPSANSQAAALEPPEVNGTRRGHVSAALRAAGIEVTSANPLLVQWVDDGCTDAQLTEAIERARQRKPAPERIPAAYLDPIVRDVMKPRIAAQPRSKEPDFSTLDHSKGVSADGRF